jgi:hypothetical protein
VQLNYLYEFTFLIKGGDPFLHFRITMPAYRQIDDVVAAMEGRALTARAVELPL